MNSATLTDAGFRPCTYPTLGPASFIKQLMAGDMPYVRDHIVGTLGVTDNDTVFVEAAIDGMVQLGIEAVGYYEDPVPLDSEEGLAILRDAGVVVLKPDNQALATTEDPQ